MLREYQEQPKLERDMAGNLLTDNDLVFRNINGKPLRPDTITGA